MSITWPDAQLARLRTLCMAGAGLLIAAALGACGVTTLRDPLPSATLALTAKVPGLDGIRAWGDEVPQDLVGELRRRLPSMPRLAASRQPSNTRPRVEILALSGGGPDGAFGAGVLTGWTARGNRPEFEVVTGVSAGAIIAPFAFLGPAYDGKLKEIWTQYETNELVMAQVLPGLLGGPALADTTPLKELIARYVDRSFLRRVAGEYRRGRMLLVGTTNLDAQRFVVWNMGEIAAADDGQALELFRSVIMASAAIPGAFPPVNIKVEAAGRIYDEMHVDGGTTREIFVSPVQAPFHRFDALYPVKPERHLYLIKNGRLTPTFQPVKPQTISIAGRAISTLILQQSLGEIYRIYREAQDDGARFNLLAVPETFKAQPTQAFDPVYQKQLFDEGYRLGVTGGPWLSRPPDLRAQQRR